jgi:signal transduction histidine kinase
MYFQYRRAFIAIFFGLATWLWPVALVAFPADDIVRLDSTFTRRDLLSDLVLFQTSNPALDVRELMNNPEKYPFRKASSREIEYTWDGETLNWVFFTLHNASDKTKSLLIQQAYVNFNEILFYEIAQGQIMRENRCGDNYPFDARLVNHRSFLYPVELKPQETRSYYFRLDNKGRASALYFNVATERHFWEKDYTKQLALGIFYGLLLLLLLHNLYLFIIFRDKAFLYFALYLFSLLALLLSLSGIAFQLLWPDIPYLADRAPHCLVFMVIFLTFILTQGLLNNDTVHPYYRWLITFCKFMSLLLMLSCFTDGFLNLLTVRMMYPMLLLGHGSLLGLNIIYLYKRHTYARFYTVSLLLMVIALAISRELYTPDFKYASYLLLTFLTFYVSIIAISLLDRLKLMKEEKEKTQQLAIERLENLNNYKEEINRELQQRVEEKTMEIINKQQEVNQSILIGEERERKRVAEELHDGLGGLLSALKLNVERIEYQNKGFSPQEQNAYQSMLEMIDKACQEVRDISHNMLPVALEHFGISIVLQNMAKRINLGEKIQLEVDVFGFDKRVDLGTELHLYRIVQELFNNILKHASAKKAVIQLVKQNKYISLLVEDDGAGFDRARAYKNGIGLLNIHSRVKLLKGNISIDTSPQSGTTIIITIPYEDLPHGNKNKHTHSR